MSPWIDEEFHDLGLVVDVANRQDIVRAAKRFKLKARIARPVAKRLDRLALPIIVEKVNGGFAILAALSAEKALIQDPAIGAVQELPRGEFEALWSGYAILITSRAFADGFARRFDFSWFIPELIRYRRIFGEVLLTGLRTYVTTHTTSRIDVALGAKLFHHLVGLPISYFEARQTGQTVARVHELESTRVFLAVMLDVFFLFVFLAVMHLYCPWLTLIVVCSIPTYIVLSVLVTPEFSVGSRNGSTMARKTRRFSSNPLSAWRRSRPWPSSRRCSGDGKINSPVMSSRASGPRISQTSPPIPLSSSRRRVVVLTTWFGAKAVLAGDLTVGQLVAFNILAGRVVKSAIIVG